MSHDIHYPILQQLGINQSEALIYELLLELGPKAANELVDPSGLGRGNVYNTLKSLTEKSLVIEETGKKALFKAVDPEQLRVLAKNKLNAAQEIMNQLEATLPALKSQFALVTKRPTFRAFEGIDGIKEVYKFMISVGETVYSLVGLGESPEELSRWFKTYYIPERVKRGVHVKGVVSSDVKGRELIEHQESELREAVNINKDRFPFSGDMSVVGNNVVFMDHKNGIATITESEPLAKTLRSTIQALMICHGATLQPTTRPEDVQ